MKTLHTAYRVTDLAASLGFYSALGYREVGRVGMDDGASLTMLKFPGEHVVTLELVHRPADGPVQVGNGFSHLVVQVDDLAAIIGALSQRGLRPGPEQYPAPAGPADIVAHRPRRLPDRAGAVAARASRRDQRRRLRLNAGQPHAATVAGNSVRA